MAEIIKFGEFLEKKEDRDAIHVPVIAVRSDDTLYPGQRIRLVTEDDVKAALVGTEHHGIVDPFLYKPVPPNTRFWMFVTPYTVGPVKHAWTHPALDDVKKKTRR